VPGLVIGAAQDRAAPPELSRQLAAGLPHSTLRIIPEAGHLVNLEAPGDFNREVLAFLRSLPAPE
jgi:pimeloyl-ACP methyl ester carboxylesterase